ncbi:MAG TPA: hypothetical protein VF210_12130 [Pseudomonadales bacterium]
MNGFLAAVGLVFVILALLHVPHPAPLLWLPYAGGAVLALLTLVPRLNILMARVLAVAATGLTFFFFAAFFLGVPRLDADWYQSQEGWSAIALLVGAFTLIPVLSVYSCRCKAECGARKGGRVLGQPGFFTAPDQRS